MKNGSICEITCLEVTPLAEERLFSEWMSRMPSFRRRKVASLRNAESQRLSLGVGILLLCALEKLGIDGKNAAITEDEFGKQTLDAYPDVHFSLSHAGDWALCGICDQPVGCDVERVERGDPRVAKRFFREDEQRALAEAREGAAWDRLFARIWTRKESYLKVTGKGLSLPLDSFSALSPAPGLWYDEAELAGGYAFSACVASEREPEFRWSTLRI